MESRLLIEIKNTKPVDLADLTKALTALGDEYRRQILAESDDPGEDCVKLFVKEIRTGSLIFELAPMAMTTLQAAGGINTVLKLGENLRAGFDYLLGRRSAKPEQIATRQNLTNYQNLVEIVAKDESSQMVFAPTVNGKAEFHFHLTSTEANAAQNRAAREIQALQEPVHGFHEKVLLYWYQTRNDTASRSGDKAIIESIAPQAVKTVFMAESVKATMLNLEENIFRQAFIVDVVVETIDNRPRLYKIQTIHEAIPRGE